MHLNSDKMYESDLHCVKEIGQHCDNLFMKISLLIALKMQIENCMKLKVDFK